MIRILIVDDQNLVREGVKVLLANTEGITVIGDAKDGESALQQIAELQPNTVLLDIEMPGINGLAVAGKIRSQFPQVKVIMLSSREDKASVQKATTQGAKGYLLKTASSSELEWAIKLVEQGYSAIKSELMGEQLFQNNTNLLDKSSKFNSVPQPIRNYSQVNGDATISHSRDLVSTSVRPQNNQTDLNKLETLLANNPVQRKRPTHFKPKKAQRFHNARLLKFRKTLASFEFKLLICIILFSLGFLIFIALS